MAKTRTADLQVVAKIDIAALRSSFKEGAKIAREELAEIGKLVAQVFTFDMASARSQAKELAKLVGDAAKVAAKEAATVAPKAQVRTPRKAPAPAEEPAPAPGPTQGSARAAGLAAAFAARAQAAEAQKAAEESAKKRESAEKQALAQILAAEMRNAQQIEALDAKLTEDLIEHIEKLQQTKKDLRAAERRETDKDAKAIIKQKRADVEEELGLALSTARKREEVDKNGAGSRVGILGIGRKLLTGQLAEASADFKKFAGGSAVSFNQVAQQVETVSSAITQLAAPALALDSVTQQIKTLGTEAAAMAPNLRAAALEMAQSGRFEFDASDIGTAMFDALAAGVKGGEEGLKGFAETAAKLATGGGAQLNEAVGLLSGQLNAYGKTSEDAGKFSDIFFNTVNYGVTSVAELSATLSNVVPTAAGLGIELENVGASLAFMTSRGIPTAASTTKLNALLLELAKPAAALEPILKRAGVSLESLKQDDLPTTLKKVSAALAESGKAAVQVFSSSEAGAAFQTLAGDLGAFEQTFRDVRDTAGSTDNAYTEMSDSVGVKTKQMLAAVNGFVAEGLGALNNGFLATLNAGTQLAPMLTSLSGLKSLLPASAVSGVLNYAKGLLGAIVPALASTATASTAAGAAGAAMWTSLIAPALPFIAIGAAIVAAIALIYNEFNEVEAAVKGAWEWIKVMFGSIEDIGLAIATGGLSVIFKAFFSDQGEEAANAFSSKFNEVLTQADIEDALEDLGDAMAEALEGKGKLDAAKGLDELVAKYKAAKTDVERNAIGEEIAKGFPSAIRKVEEFDEKTGKLVSSFELAEGAAGRISERLKADGAEDIADAQEDAVLGLQAQLQVLDQQKASVDELQAKLAAQKAQGIDTSATQTSLDEAKAAAQKAQEEIAGTLSTGKSTGLFDNLPEELQASMDKMKGGLEPVVAQMELDAANARIGETLGKAASLKGNLDSNDSLGALVQKFNDAKTDVERNGIAQAIASQVPGAVTQYDELGNAIGINTDKVLEFADAQKKGLGGEQEALRKKYADDLKEQADALSTTRDKASELQQKIIDYNEQGKDTTALREELAKTVVKADEQALSLGNNVEQGKKFGLIKGPVSEVGKELGLTTRQSNAAAIGVKAIGTQAKDAQGAAADLAAEFANMRSTIDKTVQDNLAKVALVRVKDALKEEVTQQERDEAQKAAEALKVAVARQKTFNKAFDDLQITYGLKQRERKSAQARDMSGLDADIEKERLRSQRRLADIDNDFLRSVATVQDEIRIRRIEQRAELKKLGEDLRVASANANQEEAARIRSRIAQLKGTSSSAGIFTEQIKNLEQKLADTIESAKEKIGTDILSIVDEINRGELEIDKVANELLTPLQGDADLTTLKAQGEARLELIRRNGALEIAARVTQSEHFNTVAREQAKREIDDYAAAQRALFAAQEAIADKREELSGAGKTDAEIQAELGTLGLTAALATAEEGLRRGGAALTARFQEVRAGLVKQFSGMSKEDIAKLSPELRKLALEIQNIELTTTRETDTATLEESKRQRQRAHKERLAGMKSIAEQEKATALFELDEQLAEERILHRGNQTKLEDIEREGARRRAEIEREYQQKTNGWVRLSLALRDGLIAAFSRKQDARRKEDLSKEREKLDLEERYLRESLDNRLIDYNDWTQKQAAIAARRVELEKEAGEAGFGFDAAIKEAGIVASEAFATATTKLAEDSNQQLMQSAADRDAYIQQLMADGVDRERAMKLAGEKFNSEIDAKRADALQSMAASGTAAIFALVAKGEDAKKAFGSVLFDMIESSIPGLIALIFGQSIATLGPILGPIVSGTLTAVLLGLTSIGRSALNLKEGTVRLRGPGTRTSDSIPANLSVDESVLNAGATLAGGPPGFTNEDAARFMNEKKRPVLEFFLPYYRQHIVPFVKQQVARLTVPKLTLPKLAAPSIAKPEMQISALEIASDGRLTAESVAELQAGQAMMAEELAALREDNARMAKWIRRTAKSNEAMNDRDRRRKDPPPGSRRPRGTF